MALDPTLYTTLNAHIASNAATVTFGGQTLAIQSTPVNGDWANVIADWYNAMNDTAFWGWKAFVTRQSVYFELGPANTVFDWGTYKAQAATEQNAWTQMFMGDNAPFTLLSFRDGVFSIFSGSTAQNNQRAHIFGVGRRLCTRGETVLGVVPVNAGGLVVGPNNGNTTANPLGDPTNPAFLRFNSTDDKIAKLSGSDVYKARGGV